VKREVYTTSDISIAAFLLVKGNDILAVEKDTRGQFFFSFVKTDTIEAEALSFLSSECSVYDNQMRLLRSILKNR